jgi:hypothetical protein
MKKEYYLEDLKKNMWANYKIYTEKEDSYSYSDYLINKYYYSIDFVEDPEKVKAEKISRERERKIDLILS